MVGLLAGAPVLSPFLEMPIVVHRGQRVLLTLTDPSMIIRATALALEDEPQVEGQECATGAFALGKPPNIVPSTLPAPCSHIADTD